MPAFSFLHCADIHLGCPVKGMGEVPRAIRRRMHDAPAEAFAKIVTTAIDRRVDAVVIAGDLYDAPDRNLRAQIRLRDELARLHDAGIPTFVACGNHDPLGEMVNSIQLPDSVHVFGPRVESRVLRRDGVELAQVYGISYTKPAVQRNLAAEFPDRPAGRFNIAVLHTNVGDRPGFASYAPCSVNDLTGKHFDYWALGHVHGRETIHPGNPVVHYPGNPQGLNTGEPGARGATIAHVVDDGTVSLQPIWTDIVRWHRARTRIDDMTSADDLVGAFVEIAGGLRGRAPDRTWVVRWTLAGSGPMHAELARPGFAADLADALRDAEGERAEGAIVWLERLDVATAPVRNIHRLRSQHDYLGDMLRLSEELASAPPSARTSVGDEVDTEAPAIVGAVRGGLGELLDEPRLARALGVDPWTRLRWNELLARVDALAVESLAPEEVDRE